MVALGGGGGCYTTARITKSRSVGLCLGPYGGPRGGAVSYEKGTPVAESAVSPGLSPNRNDSVIPNLLGKDLQFKNSDAMKFTIQHYVN